MTATQAPSPEQLRHIVQAAGLAPSVHNTQPWRYVDAGDGVLQLHADPSRQLGVLDPDGRQLHISCGASIVHARLAARALGLDVRTELLPERSVPTHLADLVVTPGAPASEQDVGRAAAILKRHTHRGAFDDRPVPASLLDLLRHDAVAEGAYLHEIASGDDLVQLEVLLARADALEENDERYRTETAAWVQQGPLRDDGIPLEAAGHAPGSSLRQRDFTLTHPAAVDGSLPRAEHPAVVVVCTDDDEPASWLRAGQALAAVLLRAADHGVQAQPLGQVTDVLAYRLGLRGVLGLVGLPQLVLRMGYADPASKTPRRTVDDVLVRMAH